MKQRFFLITSFFGFFALSAALLLPSAFGQEAPSTVTPSLVGSGLSSVTHEKAVLQVAFTPSNCTSANVKVEYATSAYYDANTQQYNQSTTELFVSNLSQTYYPNVSSLNAATAYTYRIAAKCTVPAESTYAYTSSATFTTTPTPQAPDSPTVIAITSSTAAPYVLTVKWKQSNLSVTADTQYYFSYTAGIEYSKNVAHDVNVTSTTERTTTLDYNLEAGKSYAIFVKGCNGTSLCSPSVVTSVFVGPVFTPGAGGLLGHWKFDGNGNNEVPVGQVAQLVGNAVFKSDGGKLGGYLYIPGSSDYAKIPYRSEFDLPQSFSVEFWFRQRADQSFLQDLVYKGKGTYVFSNNNYNFRIFRQLWNQYNFGPIITGYTATNSGYWTQTSNPNQLTHNEWHHVVYTKDAGKSAYYLDGQLVHSSSQTDAAVTPHDDIIIGDSAVDTDIDNLRIYNVALSVDEVLNNGGFPLPSTLSGSILENTTLLKSRSPYTVTGNVTVFPGVKLMVEPGVEVKFNQGTGITVRGELAASGAAATPIVFTSNLASPTKGSWSGITIDTTQGGKASLAFTTVSYAATGFSVMCCHSGGPVTITDSTFRGNTTALGGYAGSVMVTVDRTTFEDNYSAVTSADKKITNSTFKNNTYGLYQTERISVEKSTFTGHKVALWGGRGTVSQSTITGNETGVQANYDGFILKYNTITGNAVGVVMGQYDTTSSPVTYNNIHDNTTMNLKSTGTAAKTATSNWWGTTDTAAIDVKIFDGKDDANLGLVTYAPILSGAVDIVTMTAPAPIVTPSPTPSPSPTGSTLSGGLYTSLTLEKSKSPYTVTGNVTVFPGVKLTVEPGVEVKFNQGTGITVRGELAASGAAATPITFTSSLAAPTKGSWNGITIDTTQGGKASLAFATVSYASTGLSVVCCSSGGPVTITDSIFRENTTALGGYAGSVTVAVDRTTFENNTNAVTSADKKITNATFKNNTYGLYQTERISVEKSTFTGHKVALWGGRGTVTQSTITGNETGVQAFFEGFTLKHNTITGNGVGVIVGQYDTTSLPVTYNNIHDNTSHNLKVMGNAAKTATNNWWGTTDTAAIDAKIFDGKDDANLGLVTYKPIAATAIDITNIVVSPPPVTLKQCADGKDNDGDGLIDYPKDTGCYGLDDDDETAPPPADAVLKITAIEPASGVTGTKVVIIGSGFVSKNVVNFGSGYLPDLPSSDGGTKITFVVPAYLDLACAHATPRCLAPSLPTTPGVYYVSVTNATGTSNTIAFTVLKTEPSPTPTPTPTPSPTPTPTPTPSPTPTPTPGGDTGVFACSTALEEVCGEYRGQLITYGNACELNRTGATYRAKGRCVIAPVVVQKVCPQIYAPVCGRDGHTYPNACAAEGVTDVAWEGSCEKPKQDIGVTPSATDRENDETLGFAQTFAEVLRDRLERITQFTNTITNPEGQKVVLQLREQTEKQLNDLKGAMTSRDVSRMKEFGSQSKKILSDIEERVQSLTRSYTKDLIRDERERNQQLVKEYTTADRYEDAGFFGDDPIYLRAKIEKKQAILKRAEESLAKGEKRLAERLFVEAQEVLGGRDYIYTTPTDARFVEAPGLSRLLEEVRQGLTSSWEGIDYMKRESIEPDPLLIILLQKAETLYQESSKALAAGDKDEAAKLLGTLKKLGLHEKFGNFRGGTGRTVLPKTRVEEFLREITKKREHLDRGREELSRRSVDTSALEPVRVRLGALLDKAQEALKSGNEKLLVQLLDELRSIDIEAVLAQLFQNLGEKDFMEEIREPLANAGDYIAAMEKVIDELRAKKTDVVLYEKLLAATEAARGEGSLALDRGDTKSASDAVRVMFASGMKLYDTLGAKNVERFLSKKERQVVTQSFRVDATGLSNVEVLGEKATKALTKLLEKTGSDAGESFAITETLSKVSSDVVAKLIDADKQYTKEVQSLIRSMHDLPPDVRSTMLAHKVELFDELSHFAEARRMTSRVKGITRAALEQIDALKTQLADFNFPPATGAFIVKRVETFVDTLRSGTLTDPQELASYVETFQKEMATFFTKAVDEKYESGIIPAKNIDDSSVLYASAVALRDAGALAPLLTKKGEVKLAATIDGATYEKLIEAAVHENAITGADAKRLKKAKVVRGIDAVRYLLRAYDVVVPPATVQSPARLATFVKNEFDIVVTPRQLQTSLTKGVAIAIVGGVEEKRGI